ncbi:SSI family serine proteinase inhibitor [Saccharopolyspora shandongensis]|uniref:SSI family serine proteinase inhibitor n=1 Tax=Saccharopolyspora shandongensis TaxID=418495 RepID=UPI0033E304FF
MAAKRLIGRTLLAAATLAGTALAPALAHAQPASAAHGTVMNLSIRGEGRDDVRNAFLTCEPAGGSHPYAQDACQALRDVNGDFNLLSTGNSTCPLVYRPVTLTAQGRWQGKPVTFEKTYSNECVAGVATGKVFSF